VIARHDETGGRHACDKNQDRGRENEAEVFHKTERAVVPCSFSHDDVCHGSDESEVARHRGRERQEHPAQLGGTEFA